MPNGGPSANFVKPQRLSPSASAAVSAARPPRNKKVRRRGAPRCGGRHESWRSTGSGMALRAEGTVDGPIHCCPRCTASRSPPFAAETDTAQKAKNLDIDREDWHYFWSGDQPKLLRVDPNRSGPPERGPAAWLRPAVRVLSPARRPIVRKQESPTRTPFATNQQPQLHSVCNPKHQPPNHHPQPINY